MPGRAGHGDLVPSSGLLADVERSQTQSCYNIFSKGHEMRNTLKQGGGIGLTPHIAGEEASLLHWAVMAISQQEGNDSGAPYAGPCVPQDKVRSASVPSPSREGQ